jgi:hypothetical protein
MTSELARDAIAANYRSTQPMPKVDEDVNAGAMQAN